jgi:hypothetical protein
MAPATLGGLAFIAWRLAGLACGGVCVVASRRALFAVDVSRGRLLSAYVCAMLLTAMAGATVLAWTSAGRGLNAAVRLRA